MSTKILEIGRFQEGSQSHGREDGSFGSFQETFCHLPAAVIYPGGPLADGRQMTVGLSALFQEQGQFLLETVPSLHGVFQVFISHQGMFCIGAQF